MAENVEAHKVEFDNRQPYVSSDTIVEIFGKAAYKSWEGASALIDAYLELEEKLGSIQRKSMSMMNYIWR